MAHLAMVFLAPVIHTVKDLIWVVDDQVRTLGLETSGHATTSNRFTQEVID